METFRDRYCAKHHVPPDAFETAVLKRSWYPGARLLSVLLSRGHRFFACDRDFIERVGRATNPARFYDEAIEFINAPENRRFLRRDLRLRVSIRRLSRIVRDTFPDERPLRAREIRDSRSGLGL